MNEAEMLLDKICGLMLLLTVSVNTWLAIIVYLLKELLDKEGRE